MDFASQPHQVLSHGGCVNKNAIPVPTSCLLTLQAFLVSSDERGEVRHPVEPGIHCVSDVCHGLLSVSRHACPLSADVVVLCGSWYSPSAAFPSAVGQGMHHYPVVEC